MAIGTRSLLFGVHCFLIHPFFVAFAWYRLYGFPYDPRLWFAFFLHDIGYWGKPNMDGPEGERHVELGAEIVGFLFGPRWREFTLLHSRSSARRLGRSPSRLCAADKLVVYYTPWWLYLPLARATGEIYEYMAQSAAPADRGTISTQACPFRAWYAGLQQELKGWADRYAGNSADVPAAAPVRAQSNGRSERPASLLLSSCLPAMIAMAAEAVYHLATRMSVGRTLGQDGLANITTAFPYSLLLLAFSLLFGCGAACVISIRLGERNTQAAEQTLGATIALLSGVALVLTAAGFLLLDPTLQVLGAEAEASSALRTYLTILIGGTWFQLLGFGLTAMIRATGRPWLSTFIILVGLAINLAVACGSMSGLGWGLKGVAIGATASNLIMTAAGLWFFSAADGGIKLRLENLVPRLPACAGVLACGASPFLMQIVTGIAGVLFNRQLQSYGGPGAVATMGVVYAVVMTIILPTYGINLGIQPLLGFNYGARQLATVRRVLWTALAAATATTTLGFLVMTLIPGRLVTLFSGSAHPLILESGVAAMRLTAVLLPLVGFQIVGFGYFQAIGKSTQAIWLAVGRQLFLMIPAILILPRIFGLDGLWMAIPIADLGMFIITGWALLPEMRRLCASPRVPLALPV